jgi:dTDP-4-amino-4,6-dideoxygalactose transaminase
LALKRLTLNLALVEANAFATCFCNYPYYGTKVAETLFEKGLCLPSGSNLTDEERTRIKRVVLNMFKNSAILVKDYI